MTLTKMQARLALVAAIFTLTGGIVDLTRRFVERFAALDTRLAKLESAIKALDSAQPDERYRQLVKELMAAERSGANYVRGASGTSGFECSEDNKAWSPCAASG